MMLAIIIINVVNPYVLITIVLLLIWFIQLSYPKG